MSLTIHEVEQRSPAWYEARLGIVTASAVGKLLTPTLKVASNDTSRGLVTTLVAERLTGIVEETRQTDDMFRGVVEEPRARDHYSKHHADVTEVGFITEDKWSFSIGVSPDGLVGDDGMIEIKAPRAKGHIQTVLSDQMPAAHMPQVQCALLVSGRSWCDFISWHGGLPMYVTRIEPDPAWQEAILAAVAQFESDASAMTSAFLARTEGLPKTERLDLEMVL